MSERTPNEATVRRRYCEASPFREPHPSRTWTVDEGPDFDRFIARVKRDAARSALDGYADALNRNQSAAVWGWPDFVADVREWAATNYPEEDTP